MDFHDDLIKIKIKDFFATENAEEKERIKSF